VQNLSAPARFLPFLAWKSLCHLLPTMHQPAADRLAAALWAARRSEHGERWQAGDLSQHHIVIRCRCLPLHCEGTSGPREV